MHLVVRRNRTDRGGPHRSDTGGPLAAGPMRARLNDLFEPVGSIDLEAARWADTKIGGG